MAVTPTILQMEAVECGAAALAMVMAYHGRYVPLEALRVECGVSRDGSKAGNILKAARRYGFVAKAFKMELEEFALAPFPNIVFWNFNHFVVVEGFHKGGVRLNDPACGHRLVTMEEFDKAFTGVVLTFSPGPNFAPGGKKPNVLFSLASRLGGARTALIYVLLASFFLVIPGLVIPAFSKIFVDMVLVANMSSWLYPFLWGMGITAVVRAALTWLQQYFLARVEYRFAVTSATAFLWHVLRLPMEFFFQRYPGDVSGRVAINDRVANLLSGQLATSAINILMILFFAAVMLWYDVLLTLAGLAMAVLNVAFLAGVSRRRADANKRLQLEKGMLLGVTMDGLSAIETLKAGGAESDFFAKWAGYQARVLTTQQELGRQSQMLAVLPILLSMTANALILTVGGYKIMDGAMTTGMLVAFQSLMSSFMAPVNQLVALGGNLQIAEADISRLDDVLRHEIDPALARGGAQAETANDRVKLSGRLELRDVSFGYSRLDPPLIEGFNLTMEPGARVALVGASGSGKSTVAKLVSGIFEPWTGEILLDGLPRHKWPREVVNNSLAMVDQDIFLFQGSVRENITMWDSTIPEGRVLDAAKDACLHDEIASRPGAYDGPVEEQGGNFSGGQRQRLEISRALAIDPSIVVLDEATSALDPKTEMLIDAGFRRRGCTCLIVAHRLSTIRDCDEILVLDKGKVVQRGSHTVLAERDGLYRDLISKA